MSAHETAALASLEAEIVAARAVAARLSKAREKDVNRYKRRYFERMTRGIDLGAPVHWRRKPEE